MSWTVKLLLNSPATRTLPDGDRLWVFSYGKPISVSASIAERCRLINKHQGTIFDIKEDVKDKPQEQAQITLQPIAKTKRVALKKPKK